MKLPVRRRDQRAAGRVRARWGAAARSLRPVARCMGTRSSCPHEILELSAAACVLHGMERSRLMLCSLLPYLSSPKVGPHEAGDARISMHAGGPLLPTNLAALLTYTQKDVPGFMPFNCPLK
ncbi:hypothetical protein Dimus_027136 [Dionaea muscipula]